MTADEIKIPQITPDSVLIPKMETTETKPQPPTAMPQQQTQPQQVQPQQIRLQPKINQEVKKPNGLPLKIAVDFMAFSTLGSFR